MSMFRTILKVPLEEGSQLHVVVEDTQPAVFLSLHTEQGKNPSTRTTIRLSKIQAYRIAMFLAGVGNLDNTAERKPSVNKSNRYDKRDWDDMKTSPERKAPIVDIASRNLKGSDER